MKALRVAIFLMIFVICFITIHAIVVEKASNELLCDLRNIETCVDSENWEGGAKIGGALREKFDKSAFWFHVTIDSCKTNDIEETIMKIQKLIDKKQKENLYTEIVTLNKKLNYVKQEEGFSVLEIL